MTNVSKPGRSFYVSDVVAICFLAAILIPFLSQSLQGLKGAWALFIVWSVIALSETSWTAIRSTVTLRKIESLALLAWMFVVTGNAILRRGFTGESHVLFTITLVMVWLLELITSVHGKRSYYLVMGAVLAMIGLDALRSLPVLWSTPGLPRQLMAANSDPAFIADAARIGVGDYNLYTGNALALPAMATFAIRFKRAAVPLLIACGSIAFAISLSTLAGAFGVAAAGISLSVAMYFAFAKKSAIGLVAVIALVFGAIFSWTYRASSTDQGEFVIQKLQRLIVGVSDAGLVGGDETGRGDLFLLSWNTFTRNWAVGIGPSTTRENPNLYSEVGGHSSFADQLAEYGLVGFLPYIVFFGAIVMRMGWRFLDHRASLECQAGLVCSLLYVMYSVTNPIVFTPTLMALWFFGVRGFFESSIERDGSATP